MSQSPLSETASFSADNRYVQAWKAVNRLVRQGFSWSGNERHTVLKNVGQLTDSSEESSNGARFVDASFSSGLDFPEDGRALVSLDWDQDGDLDLAMSARSAPRLRLLENQLPATQTEAFVHLRLQGDPNIEGGSNLDGIGAIVELRFKPAPSSTSGPTLGPNLITQSRRCGEGFLAQSSPWLHFGLGRKSVGQSSFEAQVAWPGGILETFAGLRVGQRYVLTQGQGTAIPWSLPPDWKLLLAEESQAADQNGGLQQALPDVETVGPNLATTRQRRVVLGARVPMPRLNLKTRNHQEGTLFGIGSNGPKGVGQGVLVTLFASWCAPCAGELAEFQDAIESWKESGLIIAALSVDEEEDYEAAEDLLVRVNWTQNAGFTTEHSLSVLDTLAGALLDTEQPLALPCSFLIDPEGYLVAIYQGPVGVEQLKRDQSLFGLDREARRQEAAALPGRWFGPLPEFDANYLEAFALKRGLGQLAREFHNLRYTIDHRSRAEMEYSFGRVRAQQGDYPEAIQHFQNVIQNDPYSFAAHRDLGLVLHLSDRFEEALGSYGRALSINPGHDDTLFDRALAYAALERWEKAFADAEVLAPVDPARAVELRLRLQSIRDQARDQSNDKNLKDG